MAPPLNGRRAYLEAQGRPHECNRGGIEGSLVEQGFERGLAGFTPYDGFHRARSQLDQMKAVTKHAFDGLRTRRALAQGQSLQGTEPGFGRQRLDIVQHCLV
jgi:hypothetical protein